MSARGGFVIVEVEDTAENFGKVPGGSWALNVKGCSRTGDGRQQYL